MSSMPGILELAANLGYGQGRGRRNPKTRMTYAELTERVKNHMTQSLSGTAEYPYRKWDADTRSGLKEVATAFIKKHGSTLCPPHGTKITLLHYSKWTSK